MPAKFNPIPLVASLVVGVSLFGLLAYLAITGWPGETGVSALEFCEAIRPGPVKQPANTWSNLGFVAVGIAIAVAAGYDLPRRKSPQFDNLCVSSPFFTTTYSITAVLLGMGSGAMHASTTAWGAQVDIYSMFLWASWVISYSAMRLFGWRGVMPFLGFYIPISGLLAVKVFGNIAVGPLSNSDWFGVLIGSGIVIELITCYVHRRQFVTSFSYLAWAVVSFLAAYGAWVPSRTGGPICYPGSLWQGHALWHVLCAFSVVFVYLYGRSERAATGG
ncbi:hypothetical protein [Aeoliella sp. SH292]|uniref:hypothetical protein n=1 Tax=Aeoliella sp. SH292 TaxID=3454464 RepID=UPI003F9437E1